MTPTWLADHIQANRRSVRAGTCRRCGSPVLVGLDDDVCALTARVDPTPVDAAGELRVLAVGGWSYDLCDTRLYRRDRAHTQLHPAGLGRYPVMVSHECPIFEISTPGEVS